MNNKLEFNYFVPTPDTTANCALSRWNDGLMGLSDFLKTYMSTRQSLEFGFSRSLNIKEILNLNLAPNAAKDAQVILANAVLNVNYLHVNAALIVNLFLANAVLNV